MTLAQQEQGKSKISYCIHETEQVSHGKGLELVGIKAIQQIPGLIRWGVLKKGQERNICFVVGLRN